MKIFAKICLWLLVFLIVLLIRFPYRTVFINQIQRVEESVGASVNWEDFDAGLFGANFRGFSAILPSGFKFKADRVSLTPGFSGFTAHIKQTTTDGSAELLITPKNLTFQAKNLEVDSGSPDFRTVKLTGDLNYGLLDKHGDGELHLLVPEIANVLPVTYKNLEVGTKLTIDKLESGDSSKNSSKDAQASSGKAVHKENGGSEAAEGSAESAPQGVSGYKITNNLTLFGTGLTGQGELVMSSYTGTSSPTLSGQITAETQGLGNYTVDIGGTWAKPEWNLAGAEK